jgi:hypothetical protein
MPESIVVGAYNASLLPCNFSDYTGTSAISVTSGSTNGGKLSGWAPGEDIYAAKLDGSCGFSSGTSMSAAIHSAIIAYNVALPPFQFDDSVNAIWNNAARNNVSFLAKRGLLMLDDPKYQNSPNLVSLLITDMSEPYKNASPELFTAIFAGAPFRAVMFNPMRVSSVTLHDPLPTGMSINQGGVLSGYVDSVEGEKEEHTVSLSVTDVNGNISDGILKIVILKILPIHNVSYAVNPIIPYQLNLNNCDNEAEPCSTHEDCAGLFCDGGQVCTCPVKPGSCACRERDPNPAPFAFTDIALTGSLVGSRSISGFTNTVTITGIVGPIQLRFITTEGSFQVSGADPGELPDALAEVIIYVNGIPILPIPANNMSLQAPPTRTNQTQFQIITVYNNDTIYVEYYFLIEGVVGDGCGTANVPQWTVSNDSSGNTVLDTFNISGSITIAV